MTLKINNLNHWFPTYERQCNAKKRVLHNINLTINPGEFVGLIGPSGCGKSTLFRAILGTHPPCLGDVIINDKKITNPTRDVGIVYQHYSLYDFLTAEKNVAFGLKLDQSNLYNRWLRPFWWHKLRKQHIEESKKWLKELNLESAIGQYTTQLSGGMRQRVAIAQALIMRPKILLLDEPFGALDEATREDLQLMLLSLYQENIQAKERGEVPPHTVVMVTHELNEAFYIGDRIIGLSQYWCKGDDTGLKLGATVCYDAPAPIFHPNDPRDFTRFADQKEELKRKVFSETLTEL